MELQFEKQQMNYLQHNLCQVQNLEQTQELRVPEGMPGIGRVLGAWGQVLIRSKNWQRDSVRLSGGTLVWVLYVPEEGGTPQRLETWIPFQMDWDIPAGEPEGQLWMCPRLRFVDARSVSAGKVLIRAGLGVLAQGWVRQSADCFQPVSVPDDVELLQERIPLVLPREAGEKAFETEDRLAMPASAPRPEKLLYYTMSPVVTDTKVLTNKVVFRGAGNLHVLYTCEDGQLHSWDFEVPFSQYAELEGSYSAEAQASVCVAMTALELEPEAEGTLHLKAGLTGQYLVEDRQTVELVQDAWSPRRQVEMKMEKLELPAMLDSRRERLSGETAAAWNLDVVTDGQMLPDFPRQRREGDNLLLDQPVMVQVLGYDGEGHLQGMSQRLEGQTAVKSDASAKVLGIPQEGRMQVNPGPNGAVVQWELPVVLRTQAGQGLNQVTALELGDMQELDPGRPSLILRRVGTDRLWDIARESGSTVAAIMEANGLSGEPEPEKMLLIPVV